MLLFYIMKKIQSKKLDIGCGKYKQDGAIGIDHSDLPEIDIKHDLNIFPWPLKESSFSEIHCYHVLEHVQDVVKFMQEIYRVSEDGAKVYIKVPHASCSKSLWTDPTHYRGFTSRSFLDYFSKESYFFLMVEYMKRPSLFCMNAGCIIIPPW